MNGEPQPPDHQRFTRAKPLLVSLAAAAMTTAGLVIHLPIPAPEYALVLVDSRSNTYLAPPCVPNPGGEGLTDIGNAKKLGLQPDARCKEAGGFDQPGASIFATIGQHVGLTLPPPSRWNANGSWNW